VLKYKTRAAIVAEIADRGGLPIQKAPSDAHDYCPSFLYPMLLEGGTPQRAEDWRNHEPQFEFSVPVRARTGASTCPRKHLVGGTLRRMIRIFMYIIMYTYMIRRLLLSSAVDAGRRGWRQQLPSRGVGCALYSSKEEGVVAAAVVAW
jgi:hypothetical protein